MRWFMWASLCLAACDVNGRPTTTTSPAEKSCTESAILALLNAEDTTAETLKDLGLRSPAAHHIIATRLGNDGVSGTDDDQSFANLEDVDAVPYVGPVSMDVLQDWGAAQCGDADVCIEQEVVDLINDPDTTAQLLKDLGVYSTGASNLIAARESEDLDSIEAIDAVPYVGDGSIAALTAWAQARCMATVVFSPQYYSDSHLTRTADEIDEATDTIDVAMYSFSDSTMLNALERAVQRGVTVRVLFHGAQEDRSDLEGSRSADLEDLGIEVRWVNKIMHHKFAIIDGPREDIEAASTAVLVTGSANWSYSAATKYDENTLFFRDDPMVTLAFQQEFNLLWEHSRPIEHNEDIVSIGHVDIEDADIEAVAGSAAHFTSANMRTYTSSRYGETFAIDGNEWEIAEVLVAAIEGAESSIRMAHGHLRARPVAEALLAKRQSSPDIEIEVYLDGQEYTSAWYYGEEEDEYDDCVAAAEDDGDLADCAEQGLYFGYPLAEAGIDVRFKYYAYRWYYTYAEQMHHKYVIIDDTTVLTGSYNLSPNSEFDSMENLIVLTADRYPALVADFIENFEALWDTRRDGTYEALLSEVTDGEDDISLVFDPMALTWAEVQALKSAIAEACPDVYSDAYRDDPDDYQTCPR